MLIVEPRPTSLFCDGINRSVAHPGFFRYGLNRLAGSELPADIENFCLRKPRAVVLLTALYSSVLNFPGRVLGRCLPHKIRETIVRRVSVDVASLKSIWTWPNECRKDQAVDVVEGFPLVLSTKAYLASVIVAMIYFWAKKFSAPFHGVSRRLLRRLPPDNSIQGSDTPIITGLIQALKTRDVSPFFVYYSVGHWSLNLLWLEPGRLRALALSLFYNSSLRCSMGPERI